MLTRETGLLLMLTLESTFLSNSDLSSFSFLCGGFLLIKINKTKLLDFYIKTNSEVKLHQNDYIHS
jgi:hypothetical protein